MKKALIGRYFNTLEATKGYYDNMALWSQEHHEIVEFQNCWMIVSCEQIKAIGA